MRNAILRKRYRLLERPSLWVIFVAVVTCVLLVNVLLSATIAVGRPTSGSGHSHLHQEAWLPQNVPNIVDMARTATNLWSTTATTTTVDNNNQYDYSSSFPMGNTEACDKYLSDPNNFALQQIATSVVNQWWTDHVRKHMIHVAPTSPDRMQNQQQQQRHSNKNTLSYALTDAKITDPSTVSNMLVNLTVLLVDGSKTRLIVSDNYIITPPEDDDAAAAATDAESLSATNNTSSMLNIADATKLWWDMLESCHGPGFVRYAANHRQNKNNPNDAFSAMSTLSTYVLSPMGWLQAQLKCRDETLRRRGADEFCLQGWNHYLNKYYPFPEPWVDVSTLAPMQTTVPAQVEEKFQRSFERFIERVFDLLLGFFNLLIRDSFPRQGRPPLLLRVFNRWLGSWKEPFWRAWYRAIVPLWQPYSTIYWLTGELAVLLRRLLIQARARSQRLQTFMDQAQARYHDLSMFTMGGPGTSEPSMCPGGTRWLDGACSDLDFILTRDRFIHDFVQTARCMLHLEFALAPPPPAAEEPPRSVVPPLNPTSLSSRADLTNILLVTVAARAHNVTPACDLVASAVLRGFDVVVGVGLLPNQRFDIRWKFVYALRTVEIAFARSGLNPNTTVIVFLDAFDTLVNLDSSVVLEYFRQRTYDFAWSSEETCFPMASWPHSLGAPEYTCDVLFPKSSGRTIGRRRNKAQFVNAGGWIGRGSTAMEVLAELSRISVKGEGECHLKGTDQLLANAHLLRYRPSGRVDLDANSDFFLSGSQTVYKEGYLNRFSKTSQGLPSLCFGALESHSSNETTLCPAFYHFNGCGACDERPKVRDLLIPSRPPLLGPVGAVSVIDLGRSTLSAVPDVSFCFSSHGS